ncbi:hypothetical protein FOY91_16780 [Sphingomonas solaris]|uniref:Uncharacterized protein n=1 Tax=Alterirhizorhabdus solaris TaxID=2529389 RepID=A0A558QWL5_9SPHN|nr:hypothetical protein FOY91_16780 [Sphingomonas solaris]
MVLLTALAGATNSSPSAAQVLNKTPPGLQGRYITSPEFPNPIYVVPIGPRDTRTPRQRCLDAEIAKVGGSASPLAQATIDLKCSQR